MKTTTEILMEIAECQRRQTELICELAQLKASVGNEVVEKPPLPVRESLSGKNMTQPQTPITLAKGKKGVKALIIYAEYKLGIYVKADGTPVTNVEDLAHYLGKPIGEPFKHWKQTLQGILDSRKPLDIFMDMYNVVQKLLRKRLEH